MLSVPKPSAVSSIARTRFRAASLHLAASAVVAVLASLLVFVVWFPSPFSTLAGGAKLFLILVCVDVIMGPALTFVAASPGKRRTEFIRDLAVILALQLAAFGYGMYSMAMARPVALVFEVDRFRLLTPSDIDPNELALAPGELRDLPWLGLRTLSVVQPSDPNEFLQSIDLGLSGVPLAALPKHWRSYESRAGQAWQRAKPVSLLIEKYPQTASQLASIATAAKVPQSALRFLPVQARHATAVALLVEPSAQIVGYLPLDGDF